MENTDTNDRNKESSLKKGIELVGRRDHSEKILQNVESCQWQFLSVRLSATSVFN